MKAKKNKKEEIKKLKVINKKDNSKVIIKDIIKPKKKEKVLEKQSLNSTIIENSIKEQIKVQPIIATSEIEISKEKSIETDNQKNKIITWNGKKQDKFSHMKRPDKYTSKVILAKDQKKGTEVKLRKLDDEEWKLIDFADKKYEISNYGRVKSYFNNPEGTILRPKPYKGFYSITLFVNNKKKKFLYHKLVAIFFIPKESEDQTIVTHIDWNLLNNHYTNLKWQTKEESTKRMFKHFNELSRTNTNPTRNTKLKDADIIRLKDMLRKGIKQNVIAKLFQLSEMQITRIKRGENWGHIK